MESDLPINNKVIHTTVKQFSESKIVFCNIYKR